MDSNKTSQIKNIAIISSIALILMEGATWWAFTYYYPAIGWNGYGSNPVPFYISVALIFTGLFLLGYTMVLLTPSKEPVVP